MWGSTPCQGLRGRSAWDTVPVLLTPGGSRGPEQIGQKLCDCASGDPRAQHSPSGVQGTPQKKPNFSQNPSPPLPGSLAHSEQCATHTGPLSSWPAAGSHWESQPATSEHRPGQRRHPRYHSALGDAWGPQGLRALGAACRFSSPARRSIQARCLSTGLLAGQASLNLLGSPRA